MVIKNRAAVVGWLAVLLVLLSLALYFFVWQPWQAGHRTPAPPPRPYRIAIVSLVEIDPIVQLRDGFTGRIGDSEIKGRVRYIRLNPQGDMTRLSTLVDRLASDPPDLAYVLGTPAAQAIQGRIPSLAIVQGAVTDPVEAGLAKDWSASGRAYTGVSDLPPADLVASLAVAALGPNATLSVIYNPSEANSIAVVRRLRAAARPLGLTVLDVPAATAADVPGAVQAALLRGDGILIPPDNTVTTASRVIIQAAARARKPVIGTTESLFSDGATAVVALNYRRMGAESADLALRILKGEDPSRIPISLTKHPVVLVSRNALMGLGLSSDRFSSIQGVEIR